MPRAIWSGSISFGLVNIPVKLYSAVSRKTVHFNQLDARTSARIKQKRVSADDGAEVPYEQIVKGYELASGAYVVITDDELAALDPKALRTIDIDEFVDLAEIDPIFYDSAYYLAPDKAAKPYALLAEAMEESGKVGIAHFVMRTKQYLAAIRPKDGVLHAVDDGLRRRGQRRRARSPSWPTSTTSSCRDKELDHGPPAHRVAVGRLRARQVPGHLPRGGARAHRAQGRRRGDRRRPPAAVEPDQVIDLMAALEASVAAAKDVAHPPSHGHGVEQAEATRRGRGRRRPAGQEGGGQEGRGQEGAGQEGRGQEGDGRPQVGLAPVADEPRRPSSTSTATS